MTDRPWAGWPSTRSLLVVVILVGALIRLGGAWSGSPCTVTDQPADGAKAAAEGRCVSFNDSVTYVTNARRNADGKWFTTQVGEATPAPTALHAPGFATFLTPLIWLGIDTYEGLRYAVALLGTASIAAAALLARRLAGDRVALAAAAIVALHPMLWVNDVVLMPEGLFATVVAGVALLAYRFHDAPSVARAAVLGAGIGGATLWRNEAMSALVFIVVPLVLGLRLPVSAKLARLAAAGLAVGLVLAPWVLYNQSRFDRWQLTNGTGAGLRVGTCDETFYNDRLLGLRSTDCLAEDAAGFTADTGEAATSRAFQDSAVDYYGENLGRAPVVVLARVARFWGAWRPFESVRLDDAIEQRGAQRAQVGVLVGWVLLPLSAYGAVVLWRRRVPLSPLLGWVATSTLLAAANQPLQRFRIAGDTGLAVLAAVGLIAAFQVPVVRRLLGLDPVARAPGDDPPIGPRPAPVDDEDTAWA